MASYKGLEPVILVVRREELEDVSEIEALLREAGYDPVEKVSTRKRDSACYLTPGRITRLRYLIPERGIKKLCVYDELKPHQVTCLMKNLGVEVIDKTMLILGIFQRHAGSRDALIQIEIARLKHQLPLVREWVRRAKLGELPGFLGGGSYAIDVYYRHYKRRISRLYRELDAIRRKRGEERSRGRSAGWLYVAIVGYTNAGKTTLFNALTNLSKPTGDEMFTTLSPKSYAVPLCGRKVMLVDTIGFIKGLPLEIVEAFRAVLEEISEADALVLVVDASKGFQRIKAELETSLEVLRNVGAESKPMIVALNKIDKVDGEAYGIAEEVAKYLNGRHLNVVSVVPISALNGLNLEHLKESVCRAVRDLVN